MGAVREPSNAEARGHDGASVDAAERVIAAPLDPTAAVEGGVQQKVLKKKRLRDKGPHAGSLQELQKRPKKDSNLALLDDEVDNFRSKLNTPSTIRPSVAWWGASRFVSRGCLENLDDSPHRKSSAFTEDTQADLYNTAQAGKTAGKTGLGCGKGSLLFSTWSRAALQIVRL